MGALICRRQPLPQISWPNPVLTRHAVDFEAQPEWACHHWLEQFKPIGVVTTNHLKQWHGWWQSTKESAERLRSMAWIHHAVASGGWICCRWVLRPNKTPRSCDCNWPRSGPGFTKRWERCCQAAGECSTSCLTVGVTIGMFDGLKT